MYDFELNLREINTAVRSLNKSCYNALVEECANTLKNDNKIIISGLGKNTYICEKFVGSMTSLSLSCGFMHTNTAIHGDLGMVKTGDLIIVVSKSGTTPESLLLMDLLKKIENITLWTFSFNQNNGIAKMNDKNIVLCLNHEGGLWDIMPLNSTTVTLIVLQGLVVDIAARYGVEKSILLKNHPGGAIGSSYTIGHY